MVLYEIQAAEFPSDPLFHCLANQAPGQSRPHLNTTFDLFAQYLI